MTSILIVEDETLVAKDIASILQRLGYIVEGAVSSAEEAIRLCETMPPDLALMDIMLSGSIDGIEAARILRKRFDIPVVFLTAFTDDATLARAKTVEPLGYIVKPFHESALKSTVEVAVYRKQVERELTQRDRALNLATDMSHNAVVLVDRDGRIAFANATAGFLGRQSTEALIGQPFNQVFPLVDSISEEALSPVSTLGDRQRYDLDPNRTDLEIGDRRIPVEGHVVCLADDNDRHAVVILREANEMSPHHEDGEAAFRAMAGGIAYAMSNPLTTVLLGAEVGQELLSRLPIEDVVAAAARRPSFGSPNAESIQDRLYEIVDDVRRAGHSLRRVRLDLGQISEGDAPDTGTVDLRRCVDMICGLVFADPRAQAAVSIEHRPTPVVEGSELKFARVLHHLLKDVPRTVDRYAKIPDKVVWIETYTDGSGHPTVRVIYDRRVCAEVGYSRLLRQPRYPHAQYWEIDDAAACAIVSGMGGRTQVDEADDRMTIKLSFPIGTTEHVNAKMLTEGEPLQSDIEPQVGCRILLIERDPMAARAIQGGLAYQHDVTVVGSPAGALTLLSQKLGFDIILCDAMMAEISGSDLFEFLEAEPSGLSRRIIFFTRGAMPARVRTFLAEHDCAVLVKPFHREELHRAIRARMHRGDRGT